MRTYHNDWTIRIDYNPTTALDPVDRIGVGPRSKTVLDVYDDDHSDDDTIYVKPDGSDSYPGTYAEPMLTIAAAILACDGVRDKVIAYSATAHVFIEDYTDIVDDYCTGIFAHEDSEDVEVVLIDADTLAEFELIYSSSGFIFFSQTDGDDDTGDGTELTPYASLTKAITEATSAGTPTAVCCLDSETYTESGISITGDCTGIWAWPGQTPVFATLPQAVAGLGVTEFEVGATTYISSAVLTNGNLVLAFADGGDGGKGKFRIFDQAGAQVAATTEFEAGATTYIVVKALNNGNFVVAFADGGDGGKGKFRIYSAAGVEAVSVKIFSTTATTFVAAAVQSDDNILISYRDEGDSNKGKLAIYNNSGTAVTTSTFTTRNISRSSFAIKSDDSFLLAYQLAGGDYTLYYKMYSSAGTETVAEQIITATGVTNLTNVVWSDDSIVVAYTIGGATRSVRFSVINSSGTIIVDQSTITVTTGHELHLGVLSNDCLVLTYRYGVNSIGAYTVLGTDLSTITAAADFTGTGTEYPTVAVFDDDEFVLAYAAGDDSDKGKFRSYTLTLGNTYDVSTSLYGFTFQPSVGLIDDLFAGSAALTALYCKFAECVNSDSTASAISTTAAVDVKFSQIINNDNGIAATTTAAELTYNAVYGNSGTAIAIDGAGAGIEIEHNTIFNNGAGIRLENNDGNEVVKNNVIHANSGYAIEAYTEI